MSLLFSAWRRLMAWARGVAATLAEPGPLETDGFRRDDTVFQRSAARKPR
jgi:hypothetical protein